MKSLMEFWLSLSRPNHIAVDCLLFWFTAGTVVSLGALGWGIVREFTIPFLALTVLAGAVGALVAIVESLRLLRAHTRLPRDEFELRQRSLRNLRMAVLMAAANAFPLLVLGLAWIQGMRPFE